MFQGHIHINMISRIFCVKYSSNGTYFLNTFQCIVHVTVIGFSEEFNSHRYEEASSLLEVAALTDAMPLQVVELHLYF